MLLSHWNDPSATVGSVVAPRKHLKDSPPRLTATGQIEMGGEGMPAEVRRDLAHMINEGHINAMSIRWDEVPGKSVRRINLPSDHAYFVDAEADQTAARWGYFFEEWRAMEGSIVALGADPGALIGRARETEGQVSEFWRAMAADSIGAEVIPEPEPAADLEPELEGDVAVLLAQLRQTAGNAAEHGATPVELINSVINEPIDTDSIRAVTIGDAQIFLPSAVADQLDDEREARELEAIETPAPPEQDQSSEAEEDQTSERQPDFESLQDVGVLDDGKLVRLVGEMLDESDRRTGAKIQSLLDIAQGKV
jgi:hypothetical protein